MKRSLLALLVLAMMVTIGCGGSGTQSATVPNTSSSSNGSTGSGGDIIFGAPLPTSVAVGDFNGDGKLDLAVTDYGNNTVSIFSGNGDGTFTLKSSPATGSGPNAIAVGDFNGDGIPDLAVVCEGATPLISSSALVMALSL